jgi:hypothetical protein
MHIAIEVSSEITESVHFLCRVLPVEGETCFGAGAEKSQNEIVAAWQTKLSELPVLQQAWLSNHS